MKLFTGITLTNDPCPLFKEEKHWDNELHTDISLRTVLEYFEDEEFVDRNEYAVIGKF